MEKWADKVDVLVGDAAGKERVRKALSGPLPDFYDVVDLRKSEKETAVIAEVVEALNRFRRGMCGLPPLEFSLERIHVVSREEFHAKVCPRGDGKTMYGRVYLPRDGSLGMFAASLAHELFHAASCLWIAVRPERPPVTIVRAGMLLADPVHGLALPHFHGLNEAVTEAAAIVIRELTVNLTRTLDDEEKRAMLGVASYPEIVTVLDRLVGRLAGSSDGVIGVWSKVYADCLTGSDTFLALLEERLPGATDVLRGTGARPEEVLRAAEALGIADVAAAIKNTPA